MGIVNDGSPANALDVFVDGIINFDAFTNGAPGVITFPQATGDLPLPVLFVDANSAALSNIPVHASTWRYVFDLDGVPMFADLSEKGDGVVFTSLTEGRVANRFYEVLAAVDEFVEARGDAFSLRIVEVPALNEIAVWIRNPEQEYVFRVMKAGQATERTPERASEFFARLSSAAEGSYIFADGRTPSDDTGNDFDG